MKPPFLMLYALEDYDNLSCLGLYDKLIEQSPEFVKEIGGFVLLEKPEELEDLSPLGLNGNIEVQMIEFILKIPQKSHVYYDICILKVSQMVEKSISRTESLYNEDKSHRFSLKKS